MYKRSMVPLKFSDIHAILVYVPYKLEISTYGSDFLNFNVLESFLMVAEELNISKAAERMYISQQALSEQIKKLENYYGTKLYKHALVGRGLVLTPAGQQLVESAAQILAINRQFLSYCNDSSNSTREIRVAITSARAQLILPALLASYRKKRPNITIRVITAKHTEELVKHILNGSSDLLLSFNRLLEPTIINVPLATERLFGVATKEVLALIYKESLEKELPRIRSGIDFGEIIMLPQLLLTPKNQLRKILNSLYIQYNAVPNIVLEMDDLPTLMRLAEHSMGVTFCGEYIIGAQPHLFEKHGESDLVAFPILDAMTSFEFSVGYHSKHNLSSPEKDFITELQQFLDNCKVEKGD